MPPITTGGGDDYAPPKPCTSDADCGQRTVTSDACKITKTVDGHCSLNQTTNMGAPNPNYHTCSWTVVC